MIHLDTYGSKVEWLIRRYIYPQFPGQEGLEGSDEGPPRSAPHLSHTPYRNKEIMVTWSVKSLIVDTKIIKNMEFVL